jgi:hypothetical protein
VSEGMSLITPNCDDLPLANLFASLITNLR